MRIRININRCHTFYVISRVTKQRQDQPYKSENNYMFCASYQSSRDDRASSRLKSPQRDFSTDIMGTFRQYDKLAYNGLEMVFTNPNSNQVLGPNIHNICISPADNNLINVRKSEWVKTTYAYTLIHFSFQVNEIANKKTFCFLQKKFCLQELKIVCSKIKFVYSTFNFV